MPSTKLLPAKAESSEPSLEPEVSGSRCALPARDVTGTSSRSARSSPSASTGNGDVKPRSATPRGLEKGGLSISGTSGLPIKTGDAGSLAGSQTFLPPSGTASSGSAVALGESPLQPLHSRVSAEMEKHGLDLTAVSQALKKVLDGAGENPAEAVAAATLFFRVTSGFAPTTSKTLQLHGKVDKFFDPDIFENPGPPKLDEE